MHPFRNEFLIFLYIELTRLAFSDKSTLASAWQSSEAGFQQALRSADRLEFGLGGFNLIGNLAVHLDSATVTRKLPEEFLEVL